VTVNLVANDTDVEGDSLTVSGVTQGTNRNGELCRRFVTLHAERQLQGADSFNLHGERQQGGTATPRNVTVPRSHRAGGNKTGHTNEDTPVPSTWFPTTPSVEGDTLMVSAVHPRHHGTVSFAAAR